MSLLVKGRRDGRDIVRVTPQSAGWTYVGFAAHRLAPAEAISVALPSAEACIVILSGRATIEAGGKSWRDIGDRGSVFDDRAPYAVYLPPGREYRVTAATFRKPTRDFENAIAKGRTALVAVDVMTPLQGGVPIVVDGKVIGAIGVSGNTPQEDEDIAKVGAALFH